RLRLRHRAQPARPRHRPTLRPVLGRPPPIFAGPARGGRDPPGAGHLRPPWAFLPRWLERSRLMGYPIKQSQTAQPLLVLMTDSADHIAGKTGLSPTVTLSKNGGSFAAPAGAVTEVGSGWYKVAGDATDSGTLGPLLLHATATGADPCDDRFDVVAYDPLSA